MRMLIGVPGASRRVPSLSLGQGADLAGGEAAP